MVSERGWYDQDNLIVNPVSQNQSRKMLELVDRGNPLPVPPVVGSLLVGNQSQWRVVAIAAPVGVTSSRSIPLV